MGKNLIQQRRGRGSPTFRSRSHGFQGSAQHPSQPTGKVVDIVHCAGHSAPLLEVEYPDRTINLAIAPQNIQIGQALELGENAEIREGNVLPLKAIPEGTLVYNIELHPGDGGKLVRSSGTAARIVAKTEQGITIILPSKKEKVFLPECRAAIGTVAGSGRTEKPFLKAGTRHWKMAARNKFYPHVCGISMNAVNHPFGGKSSKVKGRPTQSPRDAPPGRKVGKIAPRRTGRRKM
ncbi:50S ribosomal protein L2 [Candidatus Woesearchaeota archaeon]|nr:50S ribosomal protein L2 [Candidatus Woesearchaeota archaeon]